MPPGKTLLIGLAFTAFLFWFFWPKRGLLALWTRASMNNQRVL